MTVLGDRIAEYGYKVQEECLGNLECAPVIGKAVMGKTDFVRGAWRYVLRQARLAGYPYIVIVLWQRQKIKVELVLDHSLE